MPDGAGWNATLEKSCSRVSRLLIHGGNKHAVRYIMRIAMVLKDKRHPENCYEILKARVKSGEMKRARSIAYFEITLTRSLRSHFKFFI